MSTAFYPTNMRRQSAGGYSNNSTLENIPYVPWKGTGLFSNPIGVTATHIRPLTNMDPGNVFPTGFGLPRPIKHYRKGTVIPINFKVLTLDPTNPGQYIEKNLIEYNVNRAVKSSIASSLGGGSGGTGIISQMIDMPGSFIVKDNGTTLNNTLDEIFFKYYANTILKIHTTEPFDYKVTIIDHNVNTITLLPGQALVFKEEDYNLIL